MDKLATQEVILKVMQPKKWWKPHQVIDALKQKGIFIDSSTFTRQSRRWRHLIDRRRPINGKRGAWEYTAW